MTIPAAEPPVKFLEYLAGFFAPYPPLVNLYFLGVAPEATRSYEPVFHEMVGMMAARNSAARFRKIGITIDTVYASRGRCDRTADFDEILVQDIAAFGPFRGILFLPDISSWLNRSGLPDCRKVQELVTRLREGGMVLYDTGRADETFAALPSILEKDGVRVQPYEGLTHGTGLAIRLPWRNIV